MNMVDERVKGYINALEGELPDYLAALEKTAKEAGVPIIRKEAQSLLRFLLRYKRPHAILEVGTAVGFSASFMSEYMPEDCTLATIERDEKSIARAKKNLAEIPYAERVLLYEGDAFCVLKRLAEEGKQFDFIFMDAAKGQYMNFLPDILRLLPQGGLLVTDNVLQEGTVVESKYALPRRARSTHMRMREYLYALKHMEEFETSVLPVGDGMALSARM